MNWSHCCYVLCLPMAAATLRTRCGWVRARWFRPTPVKCVAEAAQATGTCSTAQPAATSSVATPVCNDNLKPLTLTCPLSMWMWLYAITDAGCFDTWLASGGHNISYIFVCLTHISLLPIPAFLPPTSLQELSLAHDTIVKSKLWFPRTVFFVCVM